MTIRIECDGCDEAESVETLSSAKRVRHYAIGIAQTGSEDKAIYRHLCASCETHLRSIADPKKWAREAKHRT